MENENTMEQWIQAALESGFSEATSLDVSTLKPMPAVRDMCAADKCKAYGHNWTCPPECGTLEECEARIRRYSRGILLQTVGKLEKNIDTKGYELTEKQHTKAFRTFAELIRADYPDALCLGAGGCRLCPTCAYPEPCRFPDKAYSSMEGYGLFVTQVCRDNHAQYYHGPKTITYSACVLF